jgi:predicted phosphodiesterase
MTNQTTKRMIAISLLLIFLAVSAVRWMPASATASDYLSRTIQGKLYYNSFDSYDDTKKAGGTWTLDTANSLIKQTKNERGYAYVDAGQDSYVTEAKWRRSNMAGLAGCGIVLRFIDSGNMYYVQEENPGSSYSIKKYVSSSSTTIKTGTFSAAANNWYIIASYFNGNSKTTYIGAAGSTLGTKLTDSADTSFQTGHSTGVKGAPAAGQTDYFDWLLVQKSWTITVNGMSDNWYFKVFKGANSYKSTPSSSSTSTLDISTLADRAPYDKIAIYDASGNVILDNQFSNDVYGGDVYNFGSTTTATTIPITSTTAATTTTSTVYGFNWAWMSDTQFYSENTAWSWIYSNMTTWITRNGVSYVIHTGDVVNTATDAEYQRAKQSMDILTSAGVPYGILAGNHDSSSTLYQKYFGALNRVALVSYGGVDFIIVCLSYSSETDSSQIAWANSAFAQYPNRFGILATHSYLNIDGSYTSEGSTVYNQIVVPSTNVQMVLCGHMHGYWLNTKSIGGRTVYEALGDPQDIGMGGDGWFNILRFDVPRNQIHLQSYSSMLKAYGSYDHILNVNFSPVSTTTTSSTPSTSSTTSSTTPTDPTITTTSTVTSWSSVTQTSFSTITTTSYVPTTVTSTVTSTLPGTTSTVTNTQTSTVTLPGTTTTTTVTVRAKYKIQVTGITILQAAPGQITVRIDYKSIAQDPITVGIRKGELTLAQGDPAAPIAVVSSDPINLPTYGSAETVTFPFSSDQIVSGKTYVVRIFLWSQSPTGSGDWEAYAPEAELSITI